MTSGELLRLWREQVRDLETPPLWSDAEAFAYMSDAQDMFCRLTDGIADATTPAVTRLAVPVGSGPIRLHKSILKIRTATLVSTGAPVTIMNVEDMGPKHMRWDGRSGPLAALIEGMEENSIVPWPLPSEADAVQLAVFRRPLRRITGDAPFEIGEQHHFHLMKWMDHLAYAKQDSQTLDKQRSVDSGNAFRAYCEAAAAEQRKKRHKVRVVAYGGIPHDGAQFSDGYFTNRQPW